MIHLALLYAGFIVTVFQIAVYAHEVEMLNLNMPYRKLLLKEASSLDL